MANLRISKDMKYELVESRDFQGHWRVEHIDEEGCVYVAVFSGPKAKERAAEYADWKNKVRNLAAVPHLGNAR